MTSAPARVRGATLLALLSVAGCHSAADADRVTPDAGTTVLPGPSASATPVDAGAKPRCVLTPGPGSASFEAGDEIGEAIPYAGSFVVGTLRSRDGGRTAGIVLIGGAGAFRVDLGPVGLDAPAPQPIARGDDLFAVVSLEAPGRIAGSHDHPRSLTLFHVKGAADPKADRLLEITRESDASSAYDVVAAPIAPEAKAPGRIGGLVAWDESVGPLARSVVRLATLSEDLHAVKATQIIATAPDSAQRVDASDPRLARRESGYWLTWMARRPEHAPSSLPLPAGEIETPSQEATYGWVEGVMLDADGTPKGSARRLTSETGHPGPYAIQSYADALEVVVVEEGEGTAGGSLVRVEWDSKDRVATSTLVHGGVEEDTPPSIIPYYQPGSSHAARVIYPDISGDTRVAWLTAAPATSEPSLADRRILGPIETTTSTPAATTLAVTRRTSTPGASRWSLDSVTCR